jgi:hypothetical protein
MRILVLAGETADLGPRSRCSASVVRCAPRCRSSSLRTTLRDETDFDPPPPVRGLLATTAAARRSHLVLLTNDAVAEPTLRGTAMLQSINRTRALTTGVALLDQLTRPRTAHWLMARSLRDLGIITAADERAARRRTRRGNAGRASIRRCSCQQPSRT